MTKQLEAGDSVPDFSLATGAAKPLDLKSFKGKAIVLYFYPKDDTPGCTAEAIAFNGLRADFAEAGAEIIGVSADSPASHAKFKRKHGLELTLGSDETRAMLEAYGVWQEKMLYGRKYWGIERTTMLIDGHGRIARIWRKVKVPGHAEAVLAAVRALREAPPPFAKG